MLLEDKECEFWNLEDTNIKSIFSTEISKSRLNVKIKYVSLY